MVFHSGFAMKENSPASKKTSIEVVETLREWSILWKRHYAERNQLLWVAIHQTMTELIDLRKQLLDFSTTNDKAKELRQRILSKIDWGNRLVLVELQQIFDQGKFASTFSKNQMKWMK